MSRLVIASVVAAAEAGTLAVTYEDCGAMHAQVTDLEPISIHTGGTDTLTGIVTSDENITSARLTATVSALGVKISECSGDGTRDMVCRLPMGAGTITMKALTFPIAQGNVSILVEIQTSRWIPAGVADLDVHVAAEDHAGESVICLDVHATKARTMKEQVTVGWMCKCTSAEESRLSDAEKVDEVVQRCERSAWNTHTHPYFMHDKFFSCFSSSMGVSEACAECFDPHQAMSVTHNDCGAQHAQLTDLEFPYIHAGATDNLRGTFLFDEDVTSAYFTATVFAQGAKFSECSGNGTEDIVCLLPEDAGTVAMRSLEFPILQGEVKFFVGFNTSRFFIETLTAVDVHVAAEDQNGESIICLDLHGAMDAVVV